MVSFGDAYAMGTHRYASLSVVMALITLWLMLPVVQGLIHFNKIYYPLVDARRRADDERAS
jgi:heme exporter protein D